MTLYRVSDESGSLKVEKVGVKPLKGAMLQSQVRNQVYNLIYPQNVTGFCVINNFPPNKP